MVNCQEEKKKIIRIIVFKLLKHRIKNRNWIICPRRQFPKIVFSKSVKKNRNIDFIPKKSLTDSLARERVMGAYCAYSYCNCTTLRVHTTLEREKSWQEPSTATPGGRPGDSLCRIDDTEDVGVPPALNFTPHYQGEPKIVGVLRYYYCVPGYGKESLYHYGTLSLASVHVLCRLTLKIRNTAF